MPRSVRTPAHRAVVVIILLAVTVAERGRAENTAENWLLGHYGADKRSEFLVRRPDTPNGAIIRRIVCYFIEDRAARNRNRGAQRPAALEPGPSSRAAR